MTSKKPPKKLLTSKKEFPFRRKDKRLMPGKDPFSGLLSEVHDDVENEIDEHLDGFMKDISEAIGHHHLYKSITIEQRNEFALNVYEEIQYLTMYGEDLKRLHAEKQILLEKAESVKAHLTDFLLYQEKIRPSFKSITRLTHFLHESNLGTPLNKAWDYLDVYIRKLSHAPITAKRGPQNQIEYLIATYIADQFKKHFDRYPSTSKGSELGTHQKGPNDTPYDEVCNKISKYFNIKLAYSTRATAIKAAKAREPRGKLV